MVILDYMQARSERVVRTSARVTPDATEVGR
jgi:hypothetical protein